MKALSMRAVVLSLSLLVMSQSGISPAVADIIDAFPSVNPNFTMWVVTLPSLIMLFFILAYGFFIRYVRKRTIIILALSFFVVGGVAPAFMSDLFWILFMRGLFGVGLGFLVPLAVNLVADFYDGLERAVMMGWHSAAVNLGGLLFMFIGTLLATISWQASFYVYLIGLVIAVWIFFKLPEPERFQAEKQVKVKIPVKVLTLIGGVLIFNALFYVLMTHLPVMVDSEGLGHASQAGTALTFFMVGGFVGGMIFGRTSRMCGLYTNACGWFSTGLGVGLIAVSRSILLITIGSFWAGMSMATTMPDYLIKISHRSPLAAVSTALAFASGAAGLGQFLSPIFFEQLIILFNRGIGRFPIIAGSVILLTAGLINLILIAGSSCRDKQAKI